MRNKKTTILYRIRALKAMDAFVSAIGDEDIWASWITYAIPDAGDESDFEYIANDEDAYAECVALFRFIVKDVQA